MREDVASILDNEEIAVNAKLITPYPNMRLRRLYELYLDFKCATDMVRVEVIREMINDGFTGFCDIVRGDELTDHLKDYE